MSGTSRAERDKMPVGVNLRKAEREEALRIAHTLGLSQTQVLRLAVEAGLPLVAERFRVAIAQERAS